MCEFANISFLVAGLHLYFACLLGWPHEYISPVGLGCSKVKIHLSEHILCSQYPILDVPRTRTSLCF